MDQAKKLDVYRGDEMVGQLINDHELRFVYADSWMDGKRRPISPQLDLSAKEYRGAPVESFFENLLPEAGVRELLKLKHQVSTTFGLLAVVGGDTASDLMLLPENQKPGKAQYQAIEWSDVLASFLNQDGVIAKARDEKGLRISLAGAQRKQGVAIGQTGQLLLPLGSSASTHIVKPNIEGIDGVWASAINEAFVMNLAEQLGLGVAHSFYEPTVKACVIERYDRVQEQNQGIKKIHQLDLCQLDSKTSGTKYESDGGPSLKRCYELLKEHGVPAIDLKRFIEWIFFNLYVGNHDSHAKNLSIFFPGEGLPRLTPFYDLLCTDLYPGLAKTFAFAIGGENRPSHLTADHLKVMSQDLGIKEKYIMELAAEVAEKILEKTNLVEEIMAAIAPAGTESTMAGRLTQHIVSNTRKLQKRFG